MKIKKGWHRLRIQSSVWVGVAAIAAIAAISLKAGLTGTPIAPRTNVSSFEDPGPILPSLTEADLEKLQREIPLQLRSWFDLAGLLKLDRPPAFPESLQAFREARSAIDAETAPFLGLWQDDGGDGRTYFLSVFPSDTPGRVCLLEYRDEWRAAPEDVILEPILALSTAEVTDGHLRGSRLRSHRSAIGRTTFDLESYPVEFLGVAIDGDRIRLFVARSLPALPLDLPSEAIADVERALFERGCINERSSPNLL